MYLGVGHNGEKHHFTLAVLNVNYFHQKRTPVMVFLQGLVMAML